MNLTLPRIRQIMEAIRSRRDLQWRIERDLVRWQTHHLMNAVGGSAFSSKAAKAIFRLAASLKFSDEDEVKDYTRDPSTGKKAVPDDLFNEDGTVRFVGRENAPGSFERMVSGFGRAQ